MNILDKASYCLSCPKPRCEGNCPTGNKISKWIALVKLGKEKEAAELLYQTNPFPEITSLVCDHARQCQGACIRGIKGEPVSIPDIEYHLSSYSWPYKRKAPRGKKVALVGAGIANLSLAVFLLQEGVEVDIYEKEKELGGAILTGIPSFRFDKSPLASIKDKLTGLGARFFFNEEVNPERLNRLSKEYDNVVLGIGAEKENLAGQDLSESVVSGLKLLHDLNVDKAESHYAKYRKAYVWGGGNVALDCARSLVRIVKDVSILYRRSQVEMPGNAKEIEEAKEEGVTLTLLTNLKELRYDESGKLLGGTFVRMELGEKDESGRASFHEIPNSEFDEDFDLFVLAIGEKSEISKYGESDGSYLLKDNIYVVGDGRYGAKNVASAIADGRNLAEEILKNYEN